MLEPDTLDWAPRKKYKSHTRNVFCENINNNYDIRTKVRAQNQCILWWQLGQKNKQWISG
jgi:hypothetical protein